VGGSKKGGFLKIRLTHPKFSANDSNDEIFEEAVYESLNGIL
jgi:hypothetical protein